MSLQNTWRTRCPTLPYLLLLIGFFIVVTRVGHNDSIKMGYLYFKFAKFPVSQISQTTTKQSKKKNSKNLQTQP